MDKNVELIYKGNFNPVYQFLIFIGINLIAFASIKIFKVEQNNAWVIFQTLLFFFTVSSLAIGVFTINNPKHYYPITLISFIILFFIAKKLAEITSHLKLDEIPYMKNFVFLNILFFVLFFIASFVFRWAKEKFETM